MKSYSMCNPAIFAGVDPANDIDPWDVTLWAQEALTIIEEQMLAQFFVNRDFEPMVQTYGKTVNARLRGSFKARRKNQRDDVTVQALAGTNIPLVLNQFWHVSFFVDDWGSTRTFADLVREYIQPAAIALVEGINFSILALAVNFLARNGGKLSGLTNANIRSHILQLDGALQTGQDWGPAPCFIDSDTRSILLDVEDFTSAEKIGDGGFAITNANIGRKLGFDWLKTSQVAGSRLRAPSNSTTLDGAELKGATALTLTDGTGFAAGQIASIDGKPYRITAVSTNDITITPGLYQDVADDVPVTSVTKTTVDGAKAAEWAKAIVLDAAVTVGDILNITNTNATFDTYVVTDVDGTDVWLDRPLEVGIADGADVNIWPRGKYNFAFEPDAIMMAVRPLPKPPENLANSVVINYNGLSIRMTMTYEGRGQGVLVTFDILGGLKPLRTEKGGVLLS